MKELNNLARIDYYKTLAELASIREYSIYSINKILTSFVDPPPPGKDL